MSTKRPPPRILFIAPLPGRESTTDVIGGTKVLASEMLVELRAQGFEIDVLDNRASVTNLSPWKRQAVRLARLLRVLFETARRIRHADLVALVLAPYAANILASSIWLLAKAARRPLALRFTGSDLDLVYRRYSFLARSFARSTWLRSALVYVESRWLQRHFAARTNFRWFPNTRNIQGPVRIRRGAPARLVFLGRLMKDKGWAEALEACRGLPEDCHFHVFGPYLPETDLSLFEGHPRASYGGPLPPEEIPRILREHDLLLFPSYCEGEGYPTVVLEAFQCGLPVVAARARIIPELVEHEENGLIVEPRSAAALRSAIERLREDSELYRRLCSGAKRQGEQFRSPYWYGRMASELRSVCRSRKMGFEESPAAAGGAGGR